MITQVDRVKRWATEIRATYDQWEAQVSAGRLSRSVRRRWVTLVLLPVLLVCCGGTVVGVPVAWVARLTIEASRGEKSPDAAANLYLMALGYTTKTASCQCSTIERRTNS
ncbi:hypothetical protein [Actinoplanes sp. NPDC026619]|uniref:hypothetical protein n=1 Tax=Actinoplanes sp. NPDC026619 TaxID=3155798 RepID=UPI0033FBCB49